MKEAKARNADIELWGLPWAFPGWVDATKSNNPYSNVSRTAEYVVRSFTSLRISTLFFLDDP